MFKASIVHLLLYRVFPALLIALLFAKKILKEEPSDPEARKEHRAHEGHPIFPILLWGIIGFAFWPLPAVVLFFLSKKIEGETKVFGTLLALPFLLAALFAAMSGPY